MASDELPTPAQMREMGYAADAPPVRLSDSAWAALCGWLNMAPPQLPLRFRFMPAETAAAWERVAAAVLAREPA